MKLNGSLLNDVTYLRNNLVIVNASSSYLGKEFFTNCMYTDIKKGKYSCYKKIHFIITPSLILDIKDYIDKLDTITKIISHLSNNQIRFCFHFPYSLYKEYEINGYIELFSKLDNSIIVRHKDYYKLLFRDGFYNVEFIISKNEQDSSPYLDYKVVSKTSLNN